MPTKKLLPEQAAKGALLQALLQEIKDALLHLFEAPEHVKFNTLSLNPSDSIRNFVLQLQIQATRCNFGAELDNHLRDRLIAGIDDASLQKKMLLEPRPTFSSLRTLSEKFEELSKAVEQPAVLLHKCTKGRKQYKQVQRVSVPNSRNSRPKALKLCFSCDDSPLWVNCKFRNSKCYNSHTI